MNNKAAVAAGLVAAVLTLAACGGDVTHGTITSKEYIPAHSPVYFQPVYGQMCINRVGYVTSRVGSRSTSRRVVTRSCTSYVKGHIPIVSHHDACYELNLKNNGDTGSVCVSKDAWNGAKVGGQW